MPTATEVQQANPAHLANNTFLVNLAVTFHVVSIPLAIFILIVVLIGCVLFIVALVFIARSCIRRRFIPKRKKRPFKSVYLDEIPGVTENEEQQKFGSLEYSLEYDMDKQQLKVDVVQANNLKPRDDVESLDTYVSLSALKLKGGKSTRIGKQHRTTRKKSKHPIWNQMFAFDIEESDLKRCTLVFEVFDYDSIGQDYSLGQLHVHLKDLNEGEYAGNILERIGWLGPGEPPVNGIGELCIGLCYYPQFARIDVTVFEGRQLELGDHKATQILFEVELRGANKKHVNSSSTKSVTDTVNPYFNERMSFLLKNGKLEDCSILCRLRRHANMGTKKTLGYIELGHASPLSTGVKQWQEMLRVPSKVHVMWHVITAKTAKE